MVKFLKKYWSQIALIIVIALIAMTVYLRPSTFELPTKTDATAQTIKDVQRQLSVISEQLDSANVALSRQDKALKETLAKLKTVEWQLAVSTKLAQNNLDSLNAKFDREAAKETSDDELLKGLGL